uniref:Nucleotid_trans domain-containing protein n=1 Tax=Angiostrongylus cantonensis TaxID=6313 RepID=A0A0K0D992_ANGCA
LFFVFFIHFSFIHPILLSGAKTAISIVVLVQYASNKEQYKEAQDTVQCYALHHRYPLHLIVVEENATLSRTCPQNDFMFQRHCVVAHLMFAWPEEWFLFLDADMAIINPNHLIEEYIPSDPASAIVSYELPLQENSRKRCESFWATANHRKKVVLFRDYDSLSMYEVCMQLILASNSLQHILILQKVLGTAWARDGWLTNSVWCDKDFILHGWQKRRKDKMRFAGWHSPVVDGYWDNALCRTPHAHLNWSFSILHAQLRFTSGIRSVIGNESVVTKYKDSFIASTRAIQMRLDKAIRNVRSNFEGIQVLLEQANGAES